MARITTRQLSQFCRRVGLSLRAGVDVRRVWQQESQRGSPAHRQRATEVFRRVAAGDELAEAMRDAEGYFPKLACELVDVGERTGKLDAVLLRLADHYDHLLKLQRTFLTGIAWPSIQLGFGILIVGLLIWILGVITPAEGEPVGVFGLHGTQGLVIYVAFITSVAMMLAVVGIGLMRGWFGVWPMRCIIRLPMLGDCIRTLAMSRLTWTLATALESGIDALRSVRMAVDSTQLNYYTRHLETIEGVIRRGGEFHEALRAPGVFPEDFLDSLQVAELSGSEGESLLRLSQFYQERAEGVSKILAMIAAFAVWAIIAAILIFVIFQLFFSLYLKPINDVLKDL